MSTPEISPRTTSALQWVMMGGTTVLAAAILVAVLPLLRPRLTDEQIVREAMQRVAAEFQKLPADHPITERYGRFVSMDTSLPQMERHNGGRESGGDPPSIGTEFRCRFEKYPARVQVGIFSGKESTVEFQMDANFRAYKNRDKDFGTETLEFDGQDLWLHVTDRHEGRKEINMKSGLHGFVTHPGLHSK